MRIEQPLPMFDNAELKMRQNNTADKVAARTDIRAVIIACLTRVLGLGEALATPTGGAQGACCSF